MAVVKMGVVVGVCNERETVCVAKVLGLLSRISKGVVGDKVTDSRYGGIRFNECG
jgi:hypothetical protein